MTPAAEPPGAWTQLSIPGTGGHGTARLDALTAIAHALGCQTSSREPLTGHRQRGAHGDYYLTVYGPRPVVTWLSRSLPRVIAALDQAATAATRGYAAWLRDGCPPEDHMPAERPTLRAHWRRQYLRAYGTTLAARIAGHLLPEAPPVPAGQLCHSHSAVPAATHEATRASLAPYLPPPRVVTEESPLRTLPTSAAAYGRALEQPGRHGGSAQRVRAQQTAPRLGRRTNPSHSRGTG